MQMSWPIIRIERKQMTRPKKKICDVYNIQLKVLTEFPNFSHESLFIVLPDFLSFLFWAFFNDIEWHSMTMTRDFYDI